MLALIVIIQKVFFNISPTGYPSLMVTLLFFGGLQLLAVGVIGEYISRLLMEAKQRPLFVVDKAVGFGAVETNVQLEEGGKDKHASSSG